MESGTRNPVEKTRRGVEAMEVVEEATMEKASMGKIRERILSCKGRMGETGWKAKRQGNQERGKCVDCGESFAGGRRGRSG